MRDAKKSLKQRDKAADQAHMNRTSESVWASFPDVRQRPKGCPKYSNCNKRQAKPRYISTQKYARRWPPSHAQVLEEQKL